MSEAIFLKGVGLFLVALVRFGGFFINLPAFGETIVPMRVKAGISAICALLILPHLMRTQNVPDLGVWAYGLMGFQEMIIGLTLGFVVLITIDALKFGGEVMGMQIGFSFVQVVDPESSRSQAVVAEFLQVMMVLTFLMVDGHVILLKAFSESFEIIPVASTVISTGTVTEIIRLTTAVFLIGFQLSTPIIAIMLITDVSLGIVARTVPRMNIFQVGFAIKILLGFVVLILLLPLISDFSRTLLNNIYGQINTLLQTLAKH